MQATQTYQTVSEIPFTYAFLCDSPDTEPVNETFGTDYDSFFVRIEDGDYLHVYGMYGVIPTLAKAVHQVR